FSHACFSHACFSHACFSHACFSHACFSHACLKKKSRKIMSSRSLVLLQRLPCAPTTYRPLRPRH
ncbi:pentapeptide repeat-containing protein, partial [Allopusillimonas ginsengisoli]